MCRMDFVSYNGGMGLILHTIEPLNAEIPLAAISDDITPNSSFYVRNHFPVPELDPASWRLEVGGLVACPLSLSLASLRAMPSRSMVVTLECAGNGRARLTPQAPGEQWDLGAAGTAEWTGVPLADVLGLAGPQPGAVDLVFRGADAGPVDGRGEPVRFERSLPAAATRTALLAYAMNGAELPAVHGYPLRLVVPGWYGVASVKWLTQVDVTGQPFTGYFQVDRYCIERMPLTLQRVRSLILEPASTAASGHTLIRGVAWSGAAPIAHVDVSVGDGPWQRAAMTGVPRRDRWQWWELRACLEAGTETTIRARAADSAGNTQPEQADWNELGYANNAIHEVQVLAR